MQENTGVHVLAGEKLDEASLESKPNGYTGTGNRTRAQWFTAPGKVLPRYTCFPDIETAFSTSKKQ